MPGGELKGKVRKGAEMDWDEWIPIGLMIFGAAGLCLVLLSALVS